VGGQRVALIGRGVVCSRDANDHSGRGVRKRAIAAKVVSKQLGAGGVGRRASGIAPAILGASGGAPNRGGIGSGCVNGKSRQLTQSRCARASAQRHRAQIFRCAGASGRDATNNSMCSMNIRSGVFAA